MNDCGPIRRLMLAVVSGVAAVAGALTPTAPASAAPPAPVVVAGDHDDDRDEPRYRQWHRFCREGEEPRESGYWGHGYASCGRRPG